MIRTRYATSSCRCVRVRCRRYDCEWETLLDIVSPPCEDVLWAVERVIA
jgi:hypothetical protein